MRPRSKILANPLDLYAPVGKKGMKRAVFLDRDGTINAERGYILRTEDVELLPTAGESIRTLNGLGFLTIVITNQAALGKDLLTLEELETINQKLWDELQSQQAFYDGLYYCPHTAEDAQKCLCRKPEPGLVFQAAQDFNIDLATSFLIGDKLSDIEAGKRSGCKTVLVLTGRGRQSLENLKTTQDSRPDYICETLQDAVAWIKSMIEEEKQE